MILTTRRRLANMLANTESTFLPLPRPDDSQRQHPMKIVTVHTAKTTLSQLIAAAEAGEEVIIKRGHEAVVRLVPLVGAAKRQFGALAGKVSLDPTFFEPLPEDELDAWEG